MPPTDVTARTIATPDDARGNLIQVTQLAGYWKVIVPQDGRSLSANGCSRNGGESVGSDLKQVKMSIPGRQYPTVF